MINTINHRGDGMDLKWLHTFITVYEEGSFRGAAEKLYISQPSITVHIKHLEEALQLQLFEREHTKLTLTPAGHQYYLLAKNVMKSISQSTQDIQAYAKKHQERIHIGFTAELLSSPILRRLHTFQTLHPHLDLRFQMLEPKMIDEHLLNKKVDVVMSVSKTNISLLHSELLISERPCLVASTNIDLSPLPKNERYKYLLQNYPLFSGFLSPHHSIIEYLQQEYAMKQIQPIEECIFAIKLIKEGLGVSILPPFLIAEELHSDVIQIIGEASAIYPIEVYMNYRKNESSLQPLLDYFRTTFT